MPITALGVILAIGVLAAFRDTRAAVVYMFSESPQGVVLNYSGRMNTAALSNQGGLSDDARFIDLLGGTGPSLQILFEFQNMQRGATPPPPPYSGQSTRYSADNVSFSLNMTWAARRFYPSTAFGDTFGFYVFERSGEYNAWINLPFLYVSDDPIAGGMIFAGHTFASMGLDASESLRLFLPGNESVSVFVVPEPGACLLFSLVTACSFVVRRRHLFRCGH